MTIVGTRTTLCQAADRVGPPITNRPEQCARVVIDLPKEIKKSNSSNRDSSGKVLPQDYRPWGVKWGKFAHPYKGKTF